MAEEIIKTIENVDKLFSQIEINGQVYKSDRYQAPAKSSAGSTRTQTAQGEDVEAVVLNNTQHDFRDGDATEAVEQLQAGLNAEVSTRQQNVNDLTDEVTALQQLLSTIQSRINEINVLIPSQASASNKLTDSNSVSSAISSATSPLSSAISGIEVKIPNQASAQNQLADKEFVNSSITTNTANFLGTYTSMAQIEAIQNPTNNDYAFLEQTISAGNTVYKRYKYSSATNEWLFEYDLNNSSFTAEQWATINSGLTQASVESTASSIASTAVSAEATARANADSSLASDISSVSNTASSALTTAQGAQSTANSASSTASSALTTAQGAQSTANSASSTASSALTTAQGAQSTANSASSTASSALTTAQGAQSTANSASSIASSASSTAQLANKKCAFVNYTDLGITDATPSAIDFPNFIIRIATYLGVNQGVVALQFVKNTGNEFQVRFDTDLPFSLSEVMYIGSVVSEFVAGESKVVGLFLRLDGTEVYLAIYGVHGMWLRKIAFKN